MILTYHEIVPVASRYAYSATARQFSAHLAALQSLPDPIVPPVITFDDGHVSQYVYALPLLEQSGTKAIFFVTAGWTGIRPEFMSWAQLSRLADMGHDVQAHGWSHAFLTHCSPSQLREELTRPRLTLEDRLGRRVDAISMPGGRYNSAVLRECAAAGYRRVFVSDPYLTAGDRGGVMVAGRAMVRNSHAVEQLITLLRSENTRLSPDRIRFRAKQAVRALIGDRAYGGLWNWAAAARDKAIINQKVRG